MYSGRTFIVTGAGQGLGRAHALLLASLGGNVVVNDRVAEQASAVVDEITRAGGIAIPVVGDVGKASTASDLIDCAVDVYGELTGLVNNAGIIRDQALADLDEAWWDETLRVNLRGHTLPTRAAARYWRKACCSADASAGIVNTSSLAGMRPQPGRVAYSCSKGAINTLTQVAAQELAPYRVRVNAVAVSARTAMTDSIGMAEATSAPADGSFDYWDPANVSPMVAFLAGPQCECTGRFFFVGGGTVELWEPWTKKSEARQSRRYSLAELPEVVGGLLR